FVLLFAIGAWLGFIVLDGATYLLMALVLSAHVPLVQANALKNVALVPTTLVALIFFALDGAVDWGVGATMGVGGIAGGVLGAVVSTHATAKRWVFRMLVLAISFELVHLAVHYVFHTA
ncbi:MAG TPA: TSUP family transporter, partial [Rhizomicrobium sp.]|nr:TSUP family transporter [Rhizomicrobium sp.]